MDLFKVERSMSGYQDMLVITDHFTRYAKAVPCRNQKAPTTAKVLLDLFILLYSFSKQLHWDQDQNVESRVIKELSKLANVCKTRTAPFHRMGNLFAERFNRTLLRVLSTLSEDHNANWTHYLPSMVLALQSDQKLIYWFIPSVFDVGWHPRLSVDTFQGTGSSNQQDSQHYYAARLPERMQYDNRVAARE